MAASARAPISSPCSARMSARVTWVIRRSGASSSDASTEIAGRGAAARKHRGHDAKHGGRVCTSDERVEHTSGVHFARLEQLGSPRRFRLGRQRRHAFREPALQARPIPVAAAARAAAQSDSRTRPPAANSPATAHPSTKSFAKAGESMRRPLSNGIPRSTLRTTLPSPSCSVQTPIGCPSASCAALFAHTRIGVRPRVDPAGSAGEKGRRSGHRRPTVAPRPPPPARRTRAASDSRRGELPPLRAAGLRHRSDYRHRPGGRTTRAVPLRTPPAPAGWPGAGDRGCRRREAHARRRRRNLRQHRASRGSGYRSGSRPAAHSKSAGARPTDRPKRRRARGRPWCRP